MHYRQKDWPEWLVLAEFAINNKVQSITKVSLFIANYKKELRNGDRYKKKKKNEESNRVYRKNNESIRGSRSGSKESTGGDEATSR